MLVPVLAGRMVTVSNGPNRFGRLTFSGYEISARKLLALFSGNRCQGANCDRLSAMDQPARTARALSHIFCGTVNARFSRCACCEMP